MRRGRAWAPAAKSAALFLLPTPLLLAVVATLVAGDLENLGLVGGSLACFWGAGALALRGLVAEARYVLGERLVPARIPFKLLSAGLTALGSAAAATAAGYEDAAALVFAVMGAGGHVAFFGRDLRAPRVRVISVDGVDADAVTLQLERAHARLRHIDVSAHAIEVPEFRERLARITAIGRSILGEIERDPADAARARRFLNLYLESAERVTVEYARTHRDLQLRPVDDNFKGLLIEMERTFSEQQRKLAERELLSLDLDIEVLNTRLKRDGTGP